MRQLYHLRPGSPPAELAEEGCRFIGRTPSQLQPPVPQSPARTAEDPILVKEEKEEEEEEEEEEEDGGERERREWLHGQ